jgi:hypothetical protein
MKNILLSGKKICKSFQDGTETTTVLRDMNISVYRDDFTVIMGPSGTGKHSFPNGWRTYHGKDGTMRVLKIIRADIKHHAGVLSGIAFLLFMTAASLSTVATVFTNSRTWITSEMKRTGYGEGLMDAFNPADLDPGVQIFSDLSRSDIEAEIKRFSPITDHYAIAMPTVALNGIDYTANVITDPSRFHILKRTTCPIDTDVVPTEFLAEDLGVSIGDRVRLSANTGSAVYAWPGLYGIISAMHSLMIIMYVVVAGKIRRQQLTGWHI